MKRATGIATGIAAPLCALALASVCSFAASAAPQADSFSIAEEGFLAAAASGERGPVLDLARFYMKHGLWAEALSRLRPLEDAAAGRLAAECEFEMGRYRAAADRLASLAPDDPYYAMALTRLGAYRDAVEAFGKSPAMNAGRNIDDYHLLKAEALAFAGEANAAQGELGAADVSSNARRDFIAGAIARARKNEAMARKAFGRAAAGDDEWAARGATALAADEASPAALAALQLTRSGGAFERDLRSALGSVRLSSGDFNGGIASLRIVVDRFPRSDAAIAAADEIAAALPMLLAEESRLHPKDAAQLFFENVEFAPPGRAGDALIREATAKLKALALYDQAALILRHQVFKRLRGADRAIVAADLADLYLLNKQPGEALAVIRATRIAGLPVEAAATRRRLEARALADLGRGEDAILLLSQTPMVDDLALRAQINWDRRAWPLAARDYASYVASRATLEARADRTAAVRAATAFLLAGDRVGYRAFLQEAAPRLEGAAEGELIRSLGDVDQSQFLARVMSSYRAVYDDKAN